MPEPRGSHAISIPLRAFCLAPLGSRPCWSIGRSLLEGQPTGPHGWGRGISQKEAMRDKQKATDVHPESLLSLQSKAPPSRPPLPVTGYPTSKKTSASALIPVWALPGEEAPDTASLPWMSQCWLSHTFSPFPPGLLFLVFQHHHHEVSA